MKSELHEYFSHEYLIDDIWSQRLLREYSPNFGRTKLLLLGPEAEMVSKTQPISFLFFITKAIYFSTMCKQGLKSAVLDIATHGIDNEIWSTENVLCHLVLINTLAPQCSPP